MSLSCKRRKKGDCSSAALVGCEVLFCFPLSFQSSFVVVVGFLSVRDNVGPFFFPVLGVVPLTVFSFLAFYPTLPLLLPLDVNQKKKELSRALPREDQEGVVGIGSCRKRHRL
jgi:hypothetical protein